MNLLGIRIIHLKKTGACKTCALLQVAERPCLSCRRRDGPVGTGGHCRVHLKAALRPSRKTAGGQSSSGRTRQCSGERTA